jgi:RNA polymerase sigma-70 factor (TIGR02943 family)
MNPDEPLNSGITAQEAALWVQDHGDLLYRYAFSKVRRADTAEELVQETLLAAWRGRANFAGQSQVSVWLVGILKRKVIDWLRATIRERDHRTTLDDDKWLDEQFDGRGHWKQGPKNWGEDTLETHEFWEIIRGCSQKLPSRLRDVFVLWHLEDEPTETVCATMNIQPANLWVMLHRARFRMWRCMSQHGYGDVPNENLPHEHEA